ncbi:MAG: nucleotidyl transferase AbiEii/AbiGii toxin family protein [Alphaproteobacteria bacterium]|nr:nucleotidyl transferase AbiEii/AbiGii toxin family protein [Alphaproteobacteria bacterium]
MTINSKYKDQVALLLEVIEPALDDSRLALKGGTAINLFTMNMPRLSVDLDLVYLPVTGRDEFLVGIQDVFQKMKMRLGKHDTEVMQTAEKTPKQIRIYNATTEVKVEVNLVLRGSVYPPRLMELCPRAQTDFEKSVKILCTSFEDQYAGKFCAALDRQHPRDLFDVKLFFEKNNITEQLKRAFLVYLISGNRPIHEMIHPNLLDQRSLFADQFQGMAYVETTYEELEAARDLLIANIDVSLNQDDRDFLISVKKGIPNWGLLGIPGIEDFPGVRWKLMNIKKMGSDRQKDMLSKLEKKLSL